MPVGNEYAGLFLQATQTDEMSSVDEQQRAAADNSYSTDTDSLRKTLREVTYNKQHCLSIKGRPPANMIHRHALSLHSLPACEA